MAEQQVDPVQAREQAARNYAAQFDVEDNPAPIQDESEPAPANLPPRRADGTFKKPHPATLLKFAEELGIPPEDVAELETADLDRLVKHTARMALQLQRQQSQRDRTILNSVDQNLGNQIRNPEPPPEPVEEDLLAGAKLDDFDPVIRRVMEKVRDQEKTIKELREQVSGVGNELRTSRAQTNTDVIDDAFDAFLEKNPQYESVFGKERMGKLSQEEMQNRAMILLRAGVDLNKPVTNRMVANGIKDGTAKVYGKLAQPKPAEPQQPDPYAQLAQRQQEWQEGAVARPTQRQPASAPPGRQRAIQSVRRILDAQNAAENNGVNGAAEPEDFLE